MGRRQTLRARHGGYVRRTHAGKPGKPGAPGRVLARDLGWRREARSAWWCGLGLGGALLLADVARGSVNWPRGGCWTVIAMTLVAVLWPPYVTAGENWLAVRGLLRERRVRTDLLTRVRRSDGMSPRLVLRDVAGNRVEFDPKVLTANPLLWHHLDRGVRRARESGLLREGAMPLGALADRIDSEGARRLLRSAGLE